MVEPTLSGNCPRDETLIRTTWNFDKELAEAEELRSAQHAAATRAVELQKSLGFADVTDGQYRWQDLLRPIAEATEGVEVGGLVRFHETNTFLRRPLLKARFGPDGFDAKAFLGATFTDLWADVPRAKIVLPSPYFFLRFAEDEAFGSPEAAGEATARVVNAAAHAAVDAGAGVVQFNDPVLLHEKEPDVELARRLAGIAVRNLEVETCYYAYAGDAAPHWYALADLPVHRIGVDFLETELDELGDLSTSKSLLAGVLDSRSSVVEPTEVLSGFLDRLVSKYGERNHQATHAYDLEFVPVDVAEAKLRALAAACKVKEVAQ